MRYYLVYQCGIANVFEQPSERSPVKRVLQGAFSTCEAFARGLSHAGGIVNVAHCDEAGDIAGRKWQSGAGSMFSESKAFSLARKEA